MNNVSLVGRLTADVELRKTAGGTSVANFCIAVNRRVKREGEQTADFINCVAWRSTADFIAKYFSKGDSIALTGEIQTSSYESNGQKVYKTEVLINSASFCGGKRKASGENTSEDNFVPPDDDDELPF